MSTIRIIRSKDWINIGRSIGIYLDGEKVATVRHGEEKTFEINPGEHELYARIGWWGSPTLSFRIEPEETGQFRISAFPFANRIGMISLIILIIHIALDFLLGIPYVGLLLIPIILYISYFLTLGNKEYLQIDLIDPQRQH